MNAELMSKNPSSSSWGPRAVAGAAALALLLSGCASEGGSDEDPTDEGATAEADAEGTEEDSSPDEEAADVEDEVDAEAFADHQPPEHFPAEPLEGLDAFYDQEIQWEECEGSRHCGSVEVPLDYDQPDGETIEITFVSDSLDEDLPFMLINPGGPGSSGYDMVAEQLNFLFSSELRDAYNIVGFDPRGVDRSAPVECMTDEEYDIWNQMTGDETWDEPLEAELTEDLSTESAIMDLCIERSGEILEHADTISAARDMDILRSALDQEQLHYFGMSYGTKLGLAYGELFPERVGRFTLDAVMDVTLPRTGISEDQINGFERQLHEFAEWCAEETEECPIPGDASDVFSGISDLLTEIENEPYLEASDGRHITVTTVVTGITTTMYLDGGQQILLQGLTEWIEDGDPELFQTVADLQHGREQDGSYDFITTWPFQTIMCLDYPLEEESGAGHLGVQETNLLEPYMIGSTDFCAQLPAEPQGEPWEPSADLPEMLLLGGTKDAATPVEWAEHIHELLPNSSLLVLDGEGHISYRPGEDCVIEHVDDYMINGELFEGRQDC